MTKKHTLTLLYTNMMANQITTTRIIAIIFHLLHQVCDAMRFLKEHSRDVSLFAFLAYQNHLFDTDDIVFSPNYAHISGMLETLLCWSTKARPALSQICMPKAQTFTIRII